MLIIFTTWFVCMCISTGIHSQHKREMGNHDDDDDDGMMIIQTV